ncbi:methyltransferase [Gimesia sp.]|uniref:class I SAM-dependent methyltransferase n=1 Tax=Gimesia sp. TaxID=2024833 RepID=UPI000C62DC78|nr:methyltransferase [Gimesia sp.]MAX35893.1 methyltransferase [Gimesia sp.]HBL44510.1 methyltransferase [Planctomycetaceae bacterium]|tara:strand:+ start:4693 stop:5268 length:576 start_codon:yes stop_codon:yes gene_type:complete
MPFSITYHGQQFLFETTPELFSPKGLDRGTEAMLSTVTFASGERVLDLGCGCGVVGILAAKIVGAENVVMTDVDGEAVRISKTNAERNAAAGVTVLQSDGFRDHQETDFDWILSNPPYHEDFSVAKNFIMKGFNRLKIGGKLVMVTRRRLWYQKKLTSIFGGTEVHEIDGYFVFHAEKRRDSYAARKRRNR